MAEGLLGTDRTGPGLIGTIPRAAFLPPQVRHAAGEDRPLPIGAGQTTSQPSVVAQMVQALQLQPDDKVLEVGTGTGFAATVLGRQAGKVYTIERDPRLATVAKGIQARVGLDNVTVITGDGSGGLPSEAPFDAIMISAAVSQIPPALLQQLAQGGRLVAPIGGVEGQRLVLVQRAGEQFQASDLGPVQFVPLASGTVRPQSASDLSPSTASPPAPA